MRNRVRQFVTDSSLAYVGLWGIIPLCVLGKYEILSDRQALICFASLITCFVIGLLQEKLD
jgi:hypothetical protein